MKLLICIWIVSLWIFWKGVKRVCLLYRCWRWGWTCSKLAPTMASWRVLARFTDRSRCLPFTEDSSPASSAWSPTQVWSAQFIRWDTQTSKYMFHLKNTIFNYLLLIAVNHELGKEWSGLQQWLPTVLLQFCGLCFWTNDQLSSGSDPDSAASTR